MPATKLVEKVSLDDIGDGKLPEKVVRTIKDIDIKVEDMVEWDNHRPSLVLKIKDGVLTLEVRLRLPVKKILGAAAACLTTFLGVTNIDKFTNLDKFTELVKLLRPIFEMFK